MKCNFLKSYLLLLTSFLLLQCAVRAQGTERMMKTSSNASQLYFELGGAGVIYSFNYDGRFSKYENGLGFRVGIGGASIEGDGYIAVPVQINYLAGTKGKYIEIGAGATYAPGLYLFDDLNDNNVYGTMTIGFRKQPVGRKGFTFRAAFMPLIGFSSGGSFLPFAGVSWGYRF